MMVITILPEIFTLYQAEKKLFNGVNQILKRFWTQHR